MGCPGVKAGKTKREVALRAKKELEDAGQDPRRCDQQTQVLYPRVALQTVVNLTSIFRREFYEIFSASRYFCIGVGNPYGWVRQSLPKRSSGNARHGETGETCCYIIQAGDQLDIKFFYNPELNDSVTVRPDGKISLQLVDEVQAAGQTPAQLDDFLTEKYAKELRKPVITVIVKSFASQRVYVGGEVNRQVLWPLRRHESSPGCH